MTDCHNPEPAGSSRRTHLDRAILRPRMNPSKAALGALFALLVDAGPPDLGFASEPGRRLRQPVPAHDLTSRELDRLHAGEPLLALLPGASGQRAGRIEFLLPFDPVTAFMVVTDHDHYDLIDPAYPRSGPAGDKRRTQMPYVVDAAACARDGERYQYQLLHLPLVAPRKFAIRLHQDTRAFPWEAAWEAAPDLECADRRDPALADLFAAAVTITRSRGAWHIQPIPSALRRRPDDRRRAHVVYYVDADPGGDLSQWTGIVDAATRAAMRDLAATLAVVGARWEDHLRRHHPEGDLARYRRLRAAFFQAAG